MPFTILISSVATISVIIKKICYPTDRESTRTFLKQNLDKINWAGTPSNVCIHDIDLLKKNPDKIDWESLNSHHDAIKLLRGPHDDMLLSGGVFIWTNDDGFLKIKLPN
jgi:hypothetical protein